MHPPLDRPHPDCEDVIAQLKECHATAGIYKYMGLCNDIKTAVDQCLRAEKKRLLDEMSKELPERKARQEAIVQRAFGKPVTFSEYLEKDKEYQAAKQKAAAARNSKKEAAAAAAKETASSSS